jgi:ESS family glutamate:Na+ symporter
MVATLVIQTVLIILFAYYVVFRFCGKDYEASAITAGFVGFGIGATPNAVANVEAIKKEHGPAQIATFVIPLVGGVVLDVINVTVLTITLNFL